MQTVNAKLALEEGTQLQLQFAKRGGLLPVVVQDAQSKQVLMLASANEEAINKTLETGFACFFSTSRNRLWLKGEESGNRLKISSIKTDCDQDALLYLVEPEKGGACHTETAEGTARISCFYRELGAANQLKFT